VSSFWQLRCNDDRWSSTSTQTLGSCFLHVMPWRGEGQGKYMGMLHDTTPPQLYDPWTHPYFWHLATTCP
jgi:hypothetical protein